jgi:hypothetical protein
MQRPEAALEIDRVELTAALPAEPPDESWPEEPEEDVPWDWCAGVPDSRGWTPALPVVALAEGEGVGLPVMGGDCEGAAPGQFGAGAPGFRPPGARSAADDVWWSDRPGEDTKRSGRAMSTAAATTPATATLARDRARGESA